MKDFQKTSEAEPSQIGESVDESTKEGLEMRLKDCQKRCSEDEDPEGCEKALCGKIKKEMGEPVNEAFDPPKVNRKDDQTEPEEVYDTEALGPGMLALRYDNEGTPVYDKFQERVDDMNGDDLTYKKLKGYGEKYLKHKYEAPDEYHYTPKVRVTDKPINESTAPIYYVSTMDGKTIVGTHQYGEGFIPNKIGIEMGFKPHPTEVPNNTKISKPTDKAVNETYMDVLEENIFKVKGTIKSKEQVLNLVNKLPERVRVDETVFAVTDGENEYRLIWCRS